MSYFTTGSNELPAICFVDGVTAHEQYGVEIRSAGPCPNCNGPADVTLAFNPNDSHFYFHCPICGVWLRWCDIDGNMADLKVVKSTKTTPLDQDLNVEDRY